MSRIDTGHADASRVLATPLADGDLLAAVDLGSNSFHMIVARYVLGQLRVVDRLREMVRLAEGLDARGGLRPVVRDRALDALSRFGQRLGDIPADRVRAVATHAVRQLAAPQSFLMPAETALGHAIEVIAGREEARLVYQGVAHAQPPKPGHRRLVMDIGGGSTECIIGAGMVALERESLQVGCVSSTRRFFPDGKLSKRRWEEGLLDVGAEFQQFAGPFRALGWQEALGSSGTNKAIGEACAGLGLTKGAITAQALPVLRDRVLAAGHVDAIDLPGLSDERRPIIAGGLLVLQAAFDALGLERLLVSRAALREGVLHDLVGRISDNDPRDASVDALMVRYGIDAAQAERVAATALRLFDQVAGAWQLNADDRAMLGWAARLHELGLAIAHSQYQVHGAYVLSHSDIAGFSQHEQRFLAALVRAHRRRVPKHAFDALPDRVLDAARRSTQLLRLAMLLHRAQQADPIPRLEAHADGRHLTLVLDRTWLDARPLLAADLEGEPADSAHLDIKLAIQPRD